MSEFHFIRPIWLFLFAPMLLWLFILFKHKYQQNNGWQKICDNALLPFILQNYTKSKKYRLGLIITMFTGILAILALAGPTFERISAPVFRNDAALVIALDLSASMDATDITPSRLIRARYKIIDILRQRKSGLTALLVYAGDAFVVSPLTDDKATIINQINALSTDLMPASGSNADTVINKSKILLKQSGLKIGDILLITDEVENSINAEHYHISILGVGTKQGAPIKLSNGGFMKDATGNIIVPTLDSQHLAQLAYDNHGTYQTISDDDSDVKALMKHFLTADKISKNSDLLADKWQDLGIWLVLLILPLALLNFRKGLLIVVFIFLIPFTNDSYAAWWHSDDYQAWQKFQQKKYQESAKQFKNRQWQAAAQYRAGNYQAAVETLKNAKSAVDLYNLGNALVKSNKLNEALTAYKKSLAINPNDTDTQHNKAEVEKLLKSQNNKDNQQKNNKDKQKNDTSNNDQQENNKTNKEGDKNNEKNQQKIKRNNDNKSDSQNLDKKDTNQMKKDNKLNNKQQNNKITDANKMNKNQSKQEVLNNTQKETQRANEQWLNTIPDDPGGLLRRKFKYQYRKRNQRADDSKGW